MCTFGLLCVGQARAATVTLAWDPSPGPSFGYLVYWGTQPGTYPNILNVGNRTHAVIEGLAPSTTYYLSVRAYNAHAMVSGPSVEVATTTASALSVRDLNGDRAPDLFWQHDQSRQAGVWYMGGGAQNAAALRGAFLSSELPGWTLAATSDLNRDGKIDLIWQHDVTRQVVVWYLGGADGSTFVRADWIWATGSPGWRVGGADDFNSDGTPDLVWVQDATRRTLIWYMGGADGNQFQSWAWLYADQLSGWSLVGVGDFNRDWAPDVVWMHEHTRRVIVWYLGGPTGRTFIAWRWLSSVDWPGWTVAGAQDWNGDGTSDLVWQNEASRQVVVWYMGDPQGTTRVSYAWLAPDAVPGWKALVK